MTETEARRMAATKAKRDWRARSAAKDATTQRAWRVANRGYQTEWSRRNRENIRARVKVRYAENSDATERRRASNREYHRLNREAINGRYRRRYGDPASSLRIYSRARAALRKTAGAFDAAWLKVLIVDPCAYCGGGAGEIDHIIPVALGGRSDSDNLTAACRSCNASKGSRPLLLFLMSRVR